MSQRVNNRVSCLTPCQPDGMEWFRKRGQCLGQEEGGHAGMGALPHLPPRPLCHLGKVAPCCGSGAIKAQSITERLREDKCAHLCEEFSP